jgi:hypothetical protein
MTRPLIDECSIPMAAHSAEVRRSRQILACPSDPAGAPSGLRWRLLEQGGWRLLRGEVCFGAILYGAGVYGATYWDGRAWRSTGSCGPLAVAAHALVREVRRG